MPDPSGLPGLYNWHKADSVTGIADGDPVGSWSDSSGNGWTLTNASSNKPTYKAALAGLNSLPALGFYQGASTTGKLSHASASGSQALQTLTVVIYPTAFTASQTMVAGGQANGGLAIYLTSDRRVQVVRTGTDVMFQTAASALTVNTAYVLTVDFTSTGAINLYINGTRQSVSVANHNFSLTGSAYHVGANSGGLEPFYGFLAELVHCSTVLGPVRRAELHSYLSDKYGITVADYTTATAPLPPTGLTATPGAGQVALSWTASATGGVTSYRVYRRTTLVATVTSGTAFTEYGLPAGGVLLDYGVTAVAGGVESDPVTTTAALPLALLAGAPKIIFDSDINSDVDDLGAAAILHAMADRGECEIIGMGVSATLGGNSFALSVVNYYYGRPGIPIALRAGASSGLGTYQQTLFNEFPSVLKTTTGMSTAATLYRTLLAAAADNSVTLVCVGLLTNVAALLASTADGISALTGVQLVTQKCVRLVVMGGQYPTGSEFNFVNAIAAAQAVATTWPTRLWFSGYEIGAAIQTGALLQSTGAATNPVRRGYQVILGGAANNSWDQTAVYAALRLTDGVFGTVTAGSNTVAGDGTNTWNASPDPSGAQEQLYLTQVNIPNAAAAIEALMLAAAAPVAGPAFLGAGAGTFTFTGAAAGAASYLGAGSGTFTFTGAGVGTTTRQGVGAGSFTFTGSAAGTNRAPVNATARLGERRLTAAITRG